MWFERDDAEPLVIDCLEFDPRLRQIDVAAEVAFTAMDLTYRGRPELAGFFLRRYARAADDFDLYAVVDYFSAYRAAVRAKVAAIAACDPAIDTAQRRGAAESARRHAELAAQVLAQRGSGALVLVGGVVGTGKSTLSETLADVLDASPGTAIVSSDRVRKRRAGIGALERTGAGPDEGLYAPEAVHETYTALLERARPLLASGRVAVLDATWASRAERRRAWDLAAELGARTLFVETRCVREETLARLRRRSREGADPSDAGPERYAASVARFEAALAGECERWRVVHTDAREWRHTVAGIASQLTHEPAG